MLTHELVDSMNVWDPTGDWHLITGSMIVRGGNMNTTYGSLMLSQASSNLTAILQFQQAAMAAFGTELTFGVGSHEIIVTELATGCADTLNINVICDTTGTNPAFKEETIIVGFRDTVCFNIPPVVDTIYNACPNASGGAVDFVLLPDNCIEFTADGIGSDTACLVWCVAGICDSATLVVNTGLPAPDTVNIDLIVGQDSIICIDDVELAGGIATLENICPTQSGNNVTFTIDGNSFCVEITGDSIGLEQACIVACNDFGVCDTTILFVQVVNDTSMLIPPVAVNDDSTTVVNVPVTVPVLNNDTINGTLINIDVITLPENGTTAIDNGQITYIPRTDFCGEIDSFQYVIENEVGIDTAWVFVDIICESIMVFNGFSPNGDGINDRWVIQGIDGLDNQVRVYNRWGNLVFDREGYNNAEGWEGD